MIELKCTSCGAPLTRDGRCEYCGSLYKVQNEIVLTTAPCKLHRFQAVVSVSDLDIMRDGKMATEQATRSIVEQMAENLLTMLKIQTQRDPYRMVTMVRGELRVADPESYFWHS